MQAKQGFALLYRSRAWLMGTAMAAAMALSALAFASTAGAAEPPHKTYLGLGDSVAFGYSQALFNEYFPGEDPHKFEEALPPGSHKPNGYVLDYFLKLKAKQTKASQWNNPVNDGCPGETTDSFIGNGVVGKQLEATIPGTHGEAPCAYKYAGKFHLHHEYKGVEKTFRPSGASQLEDMLEQIQKNNSGGALKDHPITLVTLNIGANDLLAGVHKCEAEVKHEFETEGKSIFGETPEEAVKGCLEANAGKIFEHVLTNVAGILYVLRNGSQFCIPDCDGTPTNDQNDLGVNYTGKVIFDGSTTRTARSSHQVLNSCRARMSSSYCSTSERRKL